jgi:hypothetical protein
MTVGLLQEAQSTLTDISATQGLGDNDIVFFFGRVIEGVMNGELQGLLLRIAPEMP